MSRFGKSNARTPVQKAAWATYMREYRQRNLERERQRDRDRYRTNPRRRHQMKYLKFGITWEQYVALAESQDHKCAICGNGQHEKIRARFLDIDHNHETGEIRGLLCSMCNRGMGLFRDDPALMERAVAYLRLRE